jgi:hypothetical protein
MFRVKPGHAPQIRAFLDGQDDAKRQAAVSRIGTLHEARWVLFDDTQVMFASSFDGSWDQYIDDFASTVIADVFDGVLEHTEGYPGIRDPTIKEFLVAHQRTAAAYSRAYPGPTVQDIEKALRVQDAFQQLLDEAAG